MVNKNTKVPARARGTCMVEPLNPKRAFVCEGAQTTAHDPGTFTESRGRRLKSSFLGPFQTSLMCSVGTPNRVWGNEGKANLKHE